MQSSAILVTGFEPFGGFADNPSATIAETLDGQEIGGYRVVGRILPVDFARYRDVLDAALRETRPVLYVGFGLAAGEDMIRLERFGVNLADFPIPDNAGVRHADLAIEPSGPTARPSTLPCPALREALLAQGIPARLSNSAGSYLCNATLYSALGVCAALDPSPRGGFVHLPYASHQVATMLRDGAGKLDGESVAPSLPIETMIAAARIILDASLRTAAA